MTKPRSRYVAGIIYKGATPNANEIDIQSLKGVLYEDVLEHLEICKEKLHQNGRNGRATIFELVDSKRG